MGFHGNASGARTYGIASGGTMYCVLAMATADKHRNTSSVDASTGSTDIVSKETSTIEYIPAR
jgi:hypothetical protein